MLKKEDGQWRQMEKTYKILVVDDNANNILLIKTLCEKKMGHQVITAGNGQEAVEKVFEEGPDLIIMDVMMPVLDGFEATKILKKDERSKFIPIIILTALETKEDRIRGIEEGASDFLTKPIDADELFVRVRNNLKIKEYND